MKTETIEEANERWRKVINDFLQCSTEILAEDGSSWTAADEEAWIELRGAVRKP